MSKEQFIPRGDRQGHPYPPVDGGPQNGALVEFDDSGTVISMKPALRWPDGRIELPVLPPSPEEMAMLYAKEQAEYEARATIVRMVVEKLRLDLTPRPGAVFFDHMDADDLRDAVRVLLGKP